MVWLSKMLMAMKASVLTQKTNYKYYLANGSCIEYDLSPDSDLLEVIEDITMQYVSWQYINVPNQVLVSPHIFRRLELQLNERYNGIHLQNYTPPAGFSVLQLQTTVGPLRVVPVTDMEFPIFVGTHQECRDNSFNTLLEEYLCE